MAPIRRIRPNKPLEPGQTTIFSTLNGGISIAQPPLPPRLGPRPKTTGQADTVLGRRMTGGPNEKQTVELFAAVQLSQYDNAEPGDLDIVNGRVIEEEEDVDDNDYTLLKRYSYTREHKLAAIDFYQLTWKELKDGTLERLSIRYCAKRLKITRKMLRSWVANREKILAQPKGTRWSRR
jgi:hypothetical protein